MQVENQPFSGSTAISGNSGNRRFTVYGASFECPKRYEPIGIIGQGAYGVVCSAKDTRTGTQVAIKKIAGVVGNLEDGKRTLREIRLLRHFNHENIVSLRDVYIPMADGPAFQDVYTVTELMDTDLHQIISSKQALTDEHSRYFTYQILRALKYIHSGNVLHRDLKPSNILLNGNCDLKVCDFGLARNGPEEDGKLTAYVATRWYRAPELMLSFGTYTQAVDIWSVGCILGEILRRAPLFPGKDVIHQLHLITEVTGTPSRSDLASIDGERGWKYVQTHLMNRRPKSMDELFPQAQPQLRDLLGKMLVFDPRKRITVDEALQHPYFSRLHDPTDEPLCGEKCSTDLPTENLTKDMLRRYIWEETQYYRQRDAAMFGNVEQY